jgi:hypothetical protein
MSKKFREEQQDLFDKASKEIKKLKEENRLPILPPDRESFNKINDILRDKISNNDLVYFDVTDNFEKLAKKLENSREIILKLSSPYNELTT